MSIRPSEYSVQQFTMSSRRKQIRSEMRNSSCFPLTWRPLLRTCCVSLWHVKLDIFWFVRLQIITTTSYCDVLFAACLDQNGRHRRRCQDHWSPVTRATCAWPMTQSRSWTGASINWRQYRRIAVCPTWHRLRWVAKEWGIPKVWKREKDVAKESKNCYLIIQQDLESNIPRSILLLLLSSNGCSTKNCRTSASPASRAIKSRSTSAPRFWVSAEFQFVFFSSSLKLRRQTWLVTWWRENPSVDPPKRGLTCISGLSISRISIGDRRAKTGSVRIGYQLWFVLVKMANKQNYLFTRNRRRAGKKGK